MAFKCRCGATAASKCAVCGGEIVNMNSARLCQRHPAVDVETIRCVLCDRPLCFWHYVLQPLSVDGSTVLSQRCFPGCQHEFKAPEKRPGPAAVSA